MRSRREITQRMIRESRLRECALAQLEEWFREGRARSFAPELTHLSETDEREAALWAAQVYKRGLVQSRVPEKKSHSKRSQILHEQGAFRDGGGLVPQFQRLCSGELLRLVQRDIRSGGAGFFCLVDEGFLRHWDAWKDALLRAQGVFVYRPKEASKNLNTIFQILEAVPADCRGVWSIGGGITTDMGGFLAGLLEVPHRSSPTTFLSAADASVGGKTGVNDAQYGKNQIGLFYPTEHWVCCEEHFSTLSLTEVLCGAAETLKHIWLQGGDPHHTENLAKVVDGFSEERRSEFLDVFAALVDFNFAVKSSVVRLDPFERGLRKSLNFGHTIAHLLESLGDAGYLPQLPHGLAVMVGMEALFRFDFVPLEPVPENFLGLHRRILERAEIELPLRWCHQAGEPDPEQLTLGFLGQDKKNESRDDIRFVLPDFGILGAGRESGDGLPHMRSVPPQDVFGKLLLKGILEL